MTGVHPCCVLLHSSSVCTRGYQDDECKNQKKKQTNYTLLLCVYVGELILDWNESRCTQIWQTPSVVLPPSPKMPIFFSSEWKWLHTRSNTHTQIQTAKKIKTQWSVRDRRTEELEKQSNVERRYQVTGYALRIVFSFLKIIKLVNSHIRVHAFTHCGQV